MKKIFLILLSLSICLSSGALEYLVVDGSLQNTNIPFNSAGSNFQHIQIIYPHSVCSAAMGTYHHIAGLRFYAASPITLSPDFYVTIRMKTTTNNSIINMEDFTTVIPVYGGSGELSPDGKSILFKFGKSRFFDLALSSRDNIIIDISVRGLSAGQSVTSWLGDNLSSNRLSIFDDGTTHFTTSSFVPKTQFLVYERHAIQYQGSTYDVYNDGMLSATLTKFVCANSSGISNVTFSTVRENPSPNQLSSRYANLYEIPLTIPKSIAGTGNDVSVTTVGNNAFSDLVLTEDIAIAFEGIAQIGDNPWIPNTCFRSTCGSFTMNLVFYSTIPTLVGSYFGQFTGSKVEIGVLFNNANSFDATWTDSVFSQFANKGWISYPYQLTVYNAYGKTYFVRPGSVGFISFDQLPYADRKLVISLTDDSEGHNDGAFHFYDRMLDVSSTAASTERDVTLSPDGKSFTAKVNDRERFTITPKVHAELFYGVGDPYLSSSQANIHLNNRDMFAGCDSVVFVYNGEDSIPYWEFIDDIGNTDTLHTSADFIVHKHVTNRKASYFSFPFDVDADSLFAINLATGDTIRLMTADYRNPSSSPDYSIFKDYLLILCYEGYDSCSQVTSGILSANRGYLYKIFAPSLGKDTLMADVAFSSGITAPRPLYCSDCPQTVSGLSFYGPAGQQGWNLIGNPNFCYLDGSAYGPYITTISVDGYSQHAFFDDVVVKPFEAVLFQTTQDSVNVGHDVGLSFPEGYKSPNPYGNHSVHKVPASLPAVLADDDDTEFVLLRLTSPDGTSDRTAVIDDVMADSSFVIGQDLSKLFNSWSQIYICSGSADVAFKCMDIRRDSTCVVPLGFRLKESGSYTISLDPKSHLYGYVFLHDLTQGHYSPLTGEGVTLTFVAGTDTGNYSLVIVPSDKPLGVESVAQTSSTLDAYISDGHLFVENIGQGTVLSICDIAGRLLCSESVEGTFSYRFSTHGVYVVTLRGTTTGSVKVLY